MKKKFLNLVSKSIRKAIGKGIHKLHEPSFSKKELKYVSNKLKPNLFPLLESM